MSAMAVRVGWVMLPCPDFVTNGMVYLSYVESAPDGTRGAAVGRGRIDLAGGRPSIAGFEVL